MVRKTLFKAVGPRPWGFVAGERDGTQYEHSKGNWEFVARSRVGVRGWKSTERKHRWHEGVWLHRPNGTLAAGGPG